MNIYIDYFSTEADFGLKIIKRLQTIQYDFSIINYDILKGKNDELSDNELANALETFDIIIPIVEAEYLTSEIINEKLDELADKKDKYILPVIYSPTNWSSKSWIVKSKTFPEDDISISELDDNSREIVLNKLVRVVENILVQNLNSSIFNIKTFDNNQNAIFISHSHEDADFAELLKLHLDKNGLNCWIDSEKLKIGQDWRQEIDDSIEKSSAVIAIMTPEARKSEYVTYEWSFAWGKGKKIFPIMYKQTVLHPRLESLQYLDFTNRTTRPWDKLVASLKQI